MASEASTTPSAPGTGPLYKKAGVLSAVSIKQREASIASIRATWGVESIEDVFPSNIRPTKYVGNTTVNNIRSIAGRVSLSAAQALFASECKDNSGNPTPVTFSGVLNVWNAVKGSDAANDSTIDSIPKHKSKESSGRVSAGKGSDKTGKKESIKSSTTSAGGPKLIVPSPGIAPPFSMSGAVASSPDKQRTKKGDVPGNGHSTEQSSDKLLYNDKSANFESNDLFSRSLVSDHKQNPSYEFSVGKKALSDPFFLPLSKNSSTTSSGSTSLFKEPGQNPHLDVTRKRNFVADADADAQDLDPVSKKLKDDKKLEPIDKGNASDPAKPTSFKPTEKVNEKTPAEKKLAALLFSSDDEDEAQAQGSSAQVHTKGFSAPEDGADEFSKLMAEQLAKARTFFDDSPPKASEPLKAPELSKTPELPKASGLPQAIELPQALELPQDPEPQANEAKDQHQDLDLDGDTIIVDDGTLNHNQSSTGPRDTLATFPPTKEDVSDPPLKQMRQSSSLTAKSRRTSPFKGNRRTSTTPKSDFKTSLPSKIDRRASVAQKQDTKLTSLSKDNRRAPVAPMLNTSNEENPLKEFASQLSGKLGELLDFEKILNLASSEQTTSCHKLKYIFESTLRHFEQDIVLVFQEEQEHLDDY